MGQRPRQPRRLDVRRRVRHARDRLVRRDGSRRARAPRRARRRAGRGLDHRRPRQRPRRERPLVRRSVRPARHRGRRRADVRAQRRHLGQPVARRRVRRRRLARDPLPVRRRRRGGVTDVVLHIGTNDIAEGRAADQIEAGLVRFADQARAAGLRVFLTTITPSRTGPRGTAAGQATRTAVNAWVLGQGPAHSDGVFDFAAAVADPARPDRLAPAYDSGDGLHLSAAGYRALAGAVRTDALAGSPCLAGDAASSVVVSGGR
ncbi:GDSL-type esterase/lipase family protein [Pseudonocardia benzenivorans]